MNEQLSCLQVAIGDVDMALGSDTGGSVRLPSCWCGIVGLKPTYGLVPFTGVMAMDECLDHVGPMARTVHDCALLLEVAYCSKLSSYHQLIVNPLDSKGNCSATSNNTKLVHWPLMGGMLHLVQ